MRESAIYESSVRSLRCLDSVTKLASTSAQRSKSRLIELYVLDFDVLIIKLNASTMAYAKFYFSL